MTDCTLENASAPEARPLVTFALFAYNQEKYIYDAVAGALAQTYSPLEIILSDDCSSDRTFALIEEVVKDYRGPHRIVLNKNASNLGVGGHVRRIADLAKGKVIVMAAGDDISEPTRSEALAKAFASSPGIFAIFSDVRTIDENGKILEAHLKKWDTSKQITLSTLSRNGGGVGTGAAYAYRKECFEWPWQFPEFIVSEDRLLPFRAALLGSVKYIPDALVDYRISSQSLSFVLDKSRKLAMLDERHISELIETTNAAFLHGHIPKSQAESIRRIFRELPFYSRIMSAISSKQTFGRRFLARLLDNWFNRDTLWSRLVGKIV